jgi:crossover junction endonuclease EME1
VVETELKQLGANLRESETVTVRNGITWKRKITRIVGPEGGSQGEEQLSQDIPCSLSSQTSVSHEEVEEDQMMVLVPRDEAVKMTYRFKRKQQTESMGCCTLFDFVDNLSRSVPGKKLTLVLMGLESYYRSEKNRENETFRAQINGKPVKASKGNRDLPSGVKREDVDQSIIELHLRSHEIRHCPKVHVLLAEKAENVASLLQTFTKAVAAAPFKRLRNEERGLGWNASGDKGPTVSVGENGEGVLRLWRYQLEQFPKVSREVSEAIAKKYPNPVSLLKAYEGLSPPDAEQLLADIEICGKRTRRLGPEVSKRIYLFCSTRDHNVLLNSQF